MFAGLLYRMRCGACGEIYGFVARRYTQDLQALGAGAHRCLQSPQDGWRPVVVVEREGGVRAVCGRPRP